MNLLSRYTLIERIGNSVLGTVYKAQDKANGSLVTLRLLQLGLLDDAARAELEARLQRDFEAAERLQHPGIARVFDMRREGHTALIASELIDGPTVTSFVRASGGSELSQVVTAMGQALEALDFAHREGIIHRDLRPANVRVQGERIKITDFGMAGLGAGARDDATLTDRTEYMAPEQLESGSVDKRCDVHAAGAILYELLTGRSPFAGEPDGLTAMFRVMNFVPLPPSQVRPGLASAFDRVVQRALAKSPGERFASAQQFRDELRGAYSTLMRRPPPDTLVRSVFAAHYPPAGASAPTPGEPSLTSPLPEDFLAERPAGRAVSEAAPRSPPEKAGVARPAAGASDSFLSGNTLPGSTAAPVTSPPAREATSRSQRPETPARVSDTQQKAAGARADAAKADAGAPPERDKSVRRAETRVEAPARQPEAKKPAPASPAPPPPAPPTSSDLNDLLRGAVPVAAVAEPPARAKEPQVEAPVSGGTVLAPPKRAAAPDRSVESARSGPAQPPPPAAPARDAEKAQPVAGGTVLTAPKRTAPPGTEAPPPRSAAVPAERAPEPADADAEAARAKQFERTIWIPVPKDDSGLWRPPPAAKPPAPVSAPPLAAKPDDGPATSTPPPKPPAPARKNVIPLTDAAVAHGGKVLARFMGPIAMVLSRRAAEGLTDEKAFFDALAGHLADSDERYQFLREVRQRPS
ncbi:MAG TPA: protein kinase [Steroidobacteraceae bacterium]|nr:protein kinase [Steroidobacteraceae bacterium]